MAVVIAIGIWWIANTLAHLFIHRPFFRRRSANACAGAVLTLLMGVPQSLWRVRHLAHHARTARRIAPSIELALETALVTSLWTLLAARAPEFFIWSYVPGYV